MDISKEARDVIDAETDPKLASLYAQILDFNFHDSNLASETTPHIPRLRRLKLKVTLKNPKTPHIFHVYPGQPWRVPFKLLTLTSKTRNAKSKKRPLDAFRGELIEVGSHNLEDIIRAGLSVFSSARKCVKGGKKRKVAQANSNQTPGAGWRVNFKTVIKHVKESPAPINNLNGEPMYELDEAFLRDAWKCLCWTRLMPKTNADVARLEKLGAAIWVHFALPKNEWYFGTQWFRKNRAQLLKDLQAKHEAREQMVVSETQNKKAKTQLDVESFIGLGQVNINALQQLLEALGQNK